jgi:serine/threonine protein kinase
MSNCTRCFSDQSALAVFCATCHQPQTPAFDTLLNQTIAGRYSLQQRLTNGGLSTVFLAFDLQTQQPVVLKFSDPQHLTRRDMTYALDAETARAYWAEMLERMRREAEMLLSLRHPHIVQLYDTGTLNEDLRYLVLEYLQGTTLHDTLLTRPRLSLAEAVRITLALADALEHVHARGIVHRDVNPRNVMLCAERRRDGETERQGDVETERVSPSLRLSVSPPPRLSVSPSQVKLIDFGIAKFPQPHGAPPFTQHSLLRGTVAYASPEQCQNLPLDARSDVYSLGVMLYELTTGRRLFAGRTPTEIALQQIQAAPVPPRQLNDELSPDMEAVILRTLAKDPTRRPASAAAFAAELRSAARRIVIALPEPVSVAATQALPPVAAPVAETAPFHFASLERAAAPRRIWPRVLAAAAFVAICLAAGLGSLDPQRVARLMAPSDFQPLPTDVPATVNENAQQPTGAEATMEQVVATNAQAAAKHEPDAFEMMTRPVSGWAAALAARMSLPGSRKAAGAGVAPKAVVPAVAHTVSVTSENPPYATPPQAVPAPVIQSDPAHLAPPDTEHPPLEAKATEPIPMPLPAPAGAPTPRYATTARADEFPHADWQPRVIAWNGEVQGERLLRIELPGKPGRVEIPRAYRYRVGIVEPPQPGNDWACVRLRVIGRGMVNVVIRWWPR